MFKIVSFSSVVSVNTLSTFDSMEGMPSLEVQINDRPEMAGLMTRVTELENKFLALEVKEQQEQILISTNPGLKDLHEKYQVMLNLLKSHE